MFQVNRRTCSQYINNNHIQWEKHDFLIFDFVVYQIEAIKKYFVYQEFKEKSSLKNTKAFAQFCHFFLALTCLSSTKHSDFFSLIYNPTFGDR